LNGAIAVERLERFLRTDPPRDFETRHRHI